MDGDPMAGALLTALNALIEVAPPGRIVPVLRHALVELLDDPPIPTTIGERPRPSRQRGVSQPGLETWIPLRDRVLAELAARGMSRRQLAKELRIAPGTVKSMLLLRCRAHGPANNARIRKWLERRPTPVPSKGDAASQHNGDATTSDTPTKPTALPPYRLTTTQREKLAGCRELDERAVRKAAGVTAEVVAEAVAGRSLAPELVGRLVGFLEQQQPAAE